MTTILFSLAPVPIEVTYGQAGLPVAMSVSRWSGSAWVPQGSPVAAKNTNSGSGTYGAIWTPPDTAPYIVELAVFEDNTFAAYDTDYSASSRSFLYNPLPSSGNTDLTVEVTEQDEETIVEFEQDEEVVLSVGCT